MAIETAKADYGSRSSIQAISSVTPKNVLLSSKKTKSLSEFSKNNEPRMCTDNEVNSLFDYENNDRCLPDGKNFIDHIFDKFDDPQAVFFKKGETPYEKTASQYKCLASIEYSTPPQNRKVIDTAEAKSERLLAASEGRKAFCEILENVGINSNAYMADVFSSKKKKRSLNFQCSTPIASQTPSSKRIATPLPLSGIRFLGSPINLDSSNNDLSSCMTPVSRFDILHDINVSEVTENMKTILLGITCFVDVRTDKENRSEVCKDELLKIGAKVEKNFTKKVTHVVFKEGRRSTYTKAKKLGIPIVSVIWIEACKIAKGPVDPSLYPPFHLEKYEMEIPFSVITRRKVQRLITRKNRKGLHGGSLHISPATSKSSKKVGNKRKALTEIKDNKASTKITNNDRHCTKKLEFINLDEPKVLDDKDELLALDNSVVINESKDQSDSSVFAKLKLDSLPKRKSAPGALAKKKIGKIKRLNDYFKSDQNKSKKRMRSKSPPVAADIKSTAKTATNIGLQENDENLVDINENKNANKKMKLYTPNISTILREIQPETIAAANSPVTSCVKTMAPPVRKGINTKLFDLTEDSLPNPRSSISLFATSYDKPSTAKPPKPVSTIVFTSIPREDCAKLTLIVKKLGTFDVEDQVSERTSHVVTNSLRRTLNLLKGLARGCWIVPEQWIHESDVASKWLAEEHFELKSFSPAVTECRLQKQVFKKSFRMDLFSKFGPIYVSSNTLPPTQELIDLVKLCRGKIATCARGAKLIIGKKIVSDKTVVNVHEKWIIDSIFNNKCLDLDKYIITEQRTDKLKNNSNNIKRIETK